MGKRPKVWKYRKNVEKSGLSNQKIVSLMTCSQLQANQKINSLGAGISDILKIQTFPPSGRKTLLMFAPHLSFKMAVESQILSPISFLFPFL
jgi:hypothetical protein